MAAATGRWRLAATRGPPQLLLPLPQSLLRLTTRSPSPPSSLRKNGQLVEDKSRLTRAKESLKGSQRLRQVCLESRKVSIQGELPTC